MSKPSNSEPAVTASDIKHELNQNFETDRVNSTAATMAPSEVPCSTAYAHLRTPVILALLLQLAILLYLGSFNMYVLAAGRSVLLKTVPVDPRDIFRGDYLALTYDISSIKETGHHDLNQEIFVILKKGDPYWSVSYVSDKMPKVSGEQVALKGKIDCLLQDQIHVHYGLEQYFVAEGKAVLPPRARPDVEIAVDQFGNATIKQLLLNGKKMI